MASRDLQAVMDAAVDAVVLIGNDGHITGFNRSAERLFGYCAREVVGQNVRMLMGEPYRSAHDDYLRRYAETGVAHIIGMGRQVEAQRRDGSFFTAFLSVGRISDTDPPGFVGFVRDMTMEIQALARLENERDRARTDQLEEREVRQLQDRLMHVSRLTTLGEMAAGVGHELNQPLSAIATYARACQRLLAGGCTDDPDFQSSLVEIEQEAFRAGEIIRRLRQLSPPPATAREPTDLNELVQDVLPLIQGEAQAHHVQVKTELSQQAVMVAVDRVQLQHVILHLLRNGVEASTETAGPAHVVVTTRIADATAELTVSDNGRGLAPEMHDRLFMPFATTKENGTGLGLVIGRNMAETHQGKLSYRPGSPAGSTFCLTLPLLETPL